MNNRDKAMLVEFMLWLSDQIHVELDYMGLLKKYQESKEMCKLMCGGKE